MKKIFLCLAAAILAAASTDAQKTINDPNAEKRSVSGYHGISVSGGIDLYLSPGNESVAVSASESKFRERIKTEVENGILKIWYDYKGADLLKGDKKLKAYVSFKTLDKLTGSGGSDIEVDGTIKASKFDLHVSGGSDFEGNLDADELKIHASGGSDVEIGGSAKKVELHASGGSDFKGYNLKAEVCNLQASGGSDVEITASKEIFASASGSSDIHYKGSAVIKEMNSNGSSSVKKVN